MGFENRDYVRDGSGGYVSGYSSGYSGASSSWPTAIKYLILINIAVFVAETMSVRRMTTDEFIDGYVTRENVEDVFRGLGGLAHPPDMDYEELITVIRDLLKHPLNRGQLPMISPVENWLELDSRKVRQGQVWRLVTSGFCHDRSSLLHILVNMLVLYMFGTVIESIYGTREFFFIYFAALLTSSLFIVGLDTWTGENIPAVGASGAVFGVAMLFAMHFPRHIILLFFVIPMQARWLVVLYAVYDLYPVLMKLAGRPQFTGIAHAGHLGGLAFGFIYWQFHLNFERLFGYRGNRVARTRSENGRSHSAGELNPLDSEDMATEVVDELDAAVDAILRKIQNEGPESLTEEEKELLEKASNWYRDR